MSCHLGNGSSLCAVDHGRSVDTTMGFTPTEGLIMGPRRRRGPGVLAFLERTEASALQSEEMLNKKSDAGLSGISSDMRNLQAAEDHHRALLALKAYLFPCANTSALTSLRWVEWTRLFTGGIGQERGDSYLSLQGLDCMGITLDEQRNRDARGSDDVRISTDDSKVLCSSCRRARAHDGSGGAPHVKPLLHHARAGGAEQRSFLVEFRRITFT